MVLTVLSDTDKHKITGELLLSFMNFFVTLLDGGNKKVQSSVYNFCLSVS